MTRDRLLDLGTKGSGQTPYSRTADGRLTLKGGVREVLATEMLEALGVNTSKTFALFETGEQLERGDEPSPTRSAVLTRLSHGHIRIGTFQRLAFIGETEQHQRGWSATASSSSTASRRAEDDAANALRLFDLVSGATAELAASYLAAGFVHGVLNSDNINITGESFDYGPWRFTPYWDPDFTAAYFDHYGLYAFGRQPEAIHWDLAQLAGVPLARRRGAAAVRGACQLELPRSSRRWSGSSSAAWASRRRRRSAMRKLPPSSCGRCSHARSPSTASSSTGVAAATPGPRPTLSDRSAHSPARSKAAHVASRIHIGLTTSHVRCISTRSRRSGRPSPSATTGGRSTTRLMRSAGWATR